MALFEICTVTAVTLDTEITGKGHWALALALA